MNYPLYTSYKSHFFWQIFPLTCERAWMNTMEVGTSLCWRQKAGWDWAWGGSLEIAVVLLWCCANANYLSVKHWAEAGIFLIPVPDRGLALLCTKPLCSLMMIKWYIFVSWLQPGPGPGTAVVVLHSRATLRNTISCFLGDSRRMQLKINKNLECETSFS